MYVIYGIPNCDKVKRVKKAFEEKDIEYEFVNFKKYPPQKKDIRRWEKFLAELPVNKRGTTFRKFKEKYESADKNEKIEQLIENTSAIKRPIVEKNGLVLCIGLDEKFISKL